MTQKRSVPPNRVGESKNNGSSGIWRDGSNFQRKDAHKKVAAHDVNHVFVVLRM